MQIMENAKERKVHVHFHYKDFKLANNSPNPMKPIDISITIVDITKFIYTIPINKIIMTKGVRRGYTISENFQEFS